MLFFLFFSSFHHTLLPCLADPTSNKLSYFVTSNCQNHRISQVHQPTFPPTGFFLHHGLPCFSFFSFVFVFYLWSLQGQLNQILVGPGPAQPRRAGSRYWPGCPGWPAVELRHTNFELFGTTASFCVFAFLFCVFAMEQAYAWCGGSWKQAKIRKRG